MVNQTSHKAFTAIAFTICSSFFIPAKAQISISPADLQLIIGSWQGSLTYLDYTTNKPFTMPANLDIERMGRSNTFLFRHSYPEEPKANRTDTLYLSKDGLLINNETITSKRVVSSDELEIITTGTGMDGNDNKPAIIKHTYIIGKNIFIHRKEVQFAEQPEWIIRHEYKYEIRAKMLMPAQ